MGSVATQGMKGRQEPLNFREAIFAQPENLETAASAARTALAGADLAPLRERGCHPHRDGGELARARPGGPVA